VNAFLKTYLKNAGRWPRMLRVMNRFDDAPKFPPDRKCLGDLVGYLALIETNSFDPSGCSARYDFVRPAKDPLEISRLKLTIRVDPMAPADGWLQVHVDKVWNEEGEVRPVPSSFDLEVLEMHIERELAAHRQALRDGAVRPRFLGVYEFSHAAARAAQQGRRASRHAEDE
jgi:hypothetical protein